MARTSTRRWKGCPMCKAHKHAGHGDDERMPAAALRQFGAVNTGRVTRHDVDEAEVLPWEPGPAVAPWRSRKDTRRWCKGKPGREHVPGLVMKGCNSSFTCGLAPVWSMGLRRMVTRWRCYHREACSVCGKVLRERIPPADCPGRAKEAVPSCLSPRSGSAKPASPPACPAAATSCPVT